MGVLQDIYRVEQAMTAALDAEDDEAFAALSDEMAQLMEASDRGHNVPRVTVRYVPSPTTDEFQWSGPVDVVAELPTPNVDLATVAHAATETQSLDEWRAGAVHHFRP